MANHQVRAQIERIAFDRCRDGGVEIGAGHHDKGIAAAQFQHNFLDPLGRAHSDLNACLLASG